MWETVCKVKLSMRTVTIKASIKLVEGKNVEEYGINYQGKGGNS